MCRSNFYRMWEINLLKRKTKSHRESSESSIFFLSSRPPRLAPVRLRKNVAACVTAAARRTFCHPGGGIGLFVCFKGV